MRTIPQRELRNDISRILREVAAGETIQVTVRGEVVAELSPPRRRGFADRETVLRHFGEPADPTWLEELLAERRACEAEERDPWA